MIGVTAVCWASNPHVASERGGKTAEGPDWGVVTNRVGRRFKRTADPRSSDPPLARHFFEEEKKLQQEGTDGHSGTVGHKVLSQSTFPFEYLRTPLNHFHGPRPTVRVDLYSDSESRWLADTEFSFTYDDSSSTLTLNSPEGDYWLHFWVDADGDSNPIGVDDLLWWNIVTLPAAGSVWFARNVGITSPVSSFETYPYGSCTTSGLVFPPGLTTVAWQQFPESGYIEHSIVYRQQWPCDGSDSVYEEMVFPATSLSGSITLQGDAATMVGVDLKGGSSIYGTEVYLGLTFTYMTYPGFNPDSGWYIDDNHIFLQGGRFVTSSSTGTSRVSNVRAHQLADKNVEVLYDLSGSPSGGATVSIKFSSDGGSNYTITPVAGTLSGDVGTGIANGNNKRIVWNAPATLPAAFYSTQMKAAVTASDSVGQTGDISFRLQWNGSQDLDLYVTEPSGETVYYDNKLSSTGGQLDLDANFPCDSSNQSGTENVFWPAGSAPRGNYTVWAGYYSSCYGSSAVSYTISVLQGTRVVETFSETLSVEDEEGTYFNYSFTGGGGKTIMLDPLGGVPLATSCEGVPERRTRMWRRGNKNSSETKPGNPAAGDIDSGFHPAMSKSGKDGSGGLKVLDTSYSNVFTVDLRTGTAPDASFTFSPSSPDVGETVRFTDRSSGDPTSWLWSFGDGHSSSSHNPSHSYSSAGTYTVRLTARNSYGTDSVNRSVTVTAAGTVPDASFTSSPSSPDVGETVRFTDTSTGDPTTWSWNFGDGHTSLSPNPSHTYALAGSYTVRLTASNAYGADSVSRSLNVQAVSNTVTLGGLEFTADSVTQISGGYRLEGSVDINGIMTYSGLLTLTGPDNQNYYHMVGDGVLELPDVTIPGFGALVLYEGSFDQKFKDGGIHDFFESLTQFKVAGWTVKIDSLNFITGGILVEGSLSIPQFSDPDEENVHVAAEIEATTIRGIQLVGGDLEITKIGLPGGFSLEDITASYNGSTNTFEGEGSLKTATVGFTVGVEVIDGCPNGAEITISGFPVVLGNSGLQLDNYGVQAEGLCGYDPFGIGIHTDITLAGNPDPDLLSFAEMNLMYYPLTTLNGTGSVRVLKADLAQAGFYLNDEANGCAGGLCLRGELGIPSVTNAWIQGNFDASVIVLPNLSMSGEQAMRIQVPQSCWDMDFPWYVEVWACPTIGAYCQGGYPCVLAYATITFSARPGANPEAVLTGAVGISGHDFYASVTYNEDHDEDFHFHLGSDDDTKRLVAKSLGPDKSQSIEVIAPGTADAFLAIRSGGGGSMPEFTIINPNGVEYDRDGGEGIDFYEDAAHNSAVFAIENPVPGQWTLKVSGAKGSIDYVSHIVNRPPVVVITDVSPSGSGYNVRWTGTDPEDQARVDLYYATLFDGPSTGLVTSGLSATGSEKNNHWDARGVSSGTYYLRAVISDGVTEDVSFTYATPVTVIATGAPTAPTGLNAHTAGPGVVDLSWNPGGSAAGSIVQALPGGVGLDVVINVGDRRSWRLEGLDRNLGYSITVITYDEEGRRSAPSNTVSVSWQACSLQCTAAVPELAGRSDLIRFESGTTASGCSGEMTTDWTFGDGASDNQQNSIHRYAESGTYSWAYRARIENKTCSKNGSITVDEHTCTLTVIEPAGDYPIVLGTPTDIVWTTAGTACGDVVRVELFKDGTRISAIAASVTDGSYRWTPSVGLDTDARYQIKVTDISDSTYVDYSAPFVVSGDGGNMTTNNFRISPTAATGRNLNPVTMYNPHLDEYLIVWSDGRNISSRGYDIYARRVDSGGGFVGSPVRISGPAATGNEEEPFIAFDTMHRRYLVVWRDDRLEATQGKDIWAQFVTEQCEKQGINFRITGAMATGDDMAPAVAYSPDGDTFVVTWSDGRTLNGRGTDIWAQRVGGNRSKQGLNYRISGGGATDDDDVPAIVYNSKTRQFLIAFESRRNNRRAIYGRKLARNGDRVSLNFVLSGSAGTSHRSPSLAFNPDRNEYILVWSDNRNLGTRGWDIFGQRLTSSAGRNGLTFRISGATAREDESTPSIEYSREGDRYYVVWQDERNLDDRGLDIFGRLLASDGTPADEEFRVSGAAATAHEYLFEGRKAVACSKTVSTALVVWTDSRQEGTQQLDIYGVITNGG